MFNQKLYVLGGLVVSLTTIIIIFLNLGYILTLVSRNMGVVARKGIISIRFKPIIAEIKYCALSDIILRWISSFILPYCPLNITEISCDVLFVQISIQEVVDFVLIFCLCMCMHYII